MRVAISGCHRMLSKQPGSHNWAAAFAAVPQTQIVAVFDAGAQTRQDFVACWSAPDRAVAAYGDYGAMLREVRPDLLCVATRQTLHADQIEQAVDAGASVSMEPEDMFWGDRFGGVIDPFGHHWAMATHKEDLSEAEFAERAEKAMAEMAAAQQG